MAIKRGRKNNATDELKALAENDFVWIINNPMTTNIYHVYLNEEVAEQKHYREILNCLRMAEADDFFILYINNFGGYIHTAIDIMAAMKASKGQILVRVTGPIYSAAPLIALSGDKLIIEDNAFFMFHDYSGGTHGKGHEQLASVLNDKPFFDEMFKNITKGFLTAQEIKDVCAGKDLYIKRDESIKRLKRIGKLAKEGK